MKHSHRLRHLPEPLTQVIPAPGHRSQSTLHRQTSYNNHVIDRLIVHAHFGNSQVHVGRQPTVQSYVSLAVFLPRCPLAEVEETKLNRFAQLRSPTKKRIDTWVSTTLGLVDPPLTCTTTPVHE